MEKWKRNVYLLWVSQILNLISFGFGIPFIPYYIQELGISSPEQINIYSAIIMGAPAITMGIMAPIWGGLSDRFGKKLMLLRAMLAGALLIALMGFVSSVEQLIILRLFQGIFTGTITAALTLATEYTPKDKNTFTIGLMASSTYIGFSAGPFIGGFAAEFLGYRSSFFIGGVLMFLVFLMVLIFVEGDRVSNELSVRQIKTKLPLKSMFKGYMLMFLFALLFTKIAYLIFNPYLPLYVQQIRGQLEGSVSITGMISGVASLMSAIAGIFISNLGDRFEKSKLSLLFMTMSILFSISLVFSYGLFAFAIAYSLFFLVMGAVEPIIVTMNLSKVPKDQHGLLFGIQTTIGSIAWALAPTIGAYVSVSSSIHSILILIPMLLLLAFVCIAVIAWKAKAGKLQICE